MSDAIEFGVGRTAWQAAALLGGGNLAGTVDKVTVSPLAPLGDVGGEIGEGEAREARHGVIDLAASGGNSIVAPEFSCHNEAMADGLTHNGTSIVFVHARNKEGT